MQGIFTTWWNGCKIKVSVLRKLDNQIQSLGLSRLDLLLASSSIFYSKAYFFPSFLTSTDHNSLIPTFQYCFKVVSNMFTDFIITLPSLLIPPFLILLHRVPALDFRWDCQHLNSYLYLQFPQENKQEGRIFLFDKMVAG